MEYIKSKEAIFRFVDGEWERVPNTYEKNKEKQIVDYNIEDSVEMRVGSECINGMPPEGDRMKLYAFYLFEDRDGKLVSVQRTPERLMYYPNPRSLLFIVDEAQIGAIYRITIAEPNELIEPEQYTLNTRVNDVIHMYREV